MIDHHSDETLRPVLREIEHKLDAQIAEACRAAPAADETTGRLQKLSDTLASAAESARAAAAMRRQLRTKKSADRGTAGPRANGDGTRPNSPSTDVRRTGTPARGVPARRAEGMYRDEE
jgi:hypothetical protein